MSETQTQKLARKLRTDGAYIDAHWTTNQGLINRAASRLEELESALITMLSTSQFPDRSHEWVKQAEEKAQTALHRPAEPCGLCGQNEAKHCSACILEIGDAA